MTEPERCESGPRCRTCLTAERDELRAALRDLREYIYWPDRAAAYVGEDVLRARIDALIGPYGEQGAQSANVSKGVKSIA